MIPIVQISRIVGAALFAVGAGFPVFAFRASNAPLEPTSDTLRHHK
jgi:hypothetical protein